MDFGRESHGAWIVVTLSKPVSPGPHRWRMFNARYRNDCVSDGLASVTTRVLEGDGAGTLVGGKNPLATSALLVQVDLVRGRTVMVSPTSYDASHYRPIGEPEYLYRAK